MSVFFVIFGRLNGLDHLATVLSVRTEVPSGSDSNDQTGRRPSRV